MGRHAKTPEAHALAGNPGKRQHNVDAVTPRPDPGETPPPAPEQLKGYARDEWIRQASEAHRLRLVTTLDLSMFEMYCHAFGAWRTYVDLCDKIGPEDAIKLGYRGEARKSLAQARLLAKCLGFDPASRGQIKTPANGPVQTSLLPDTDKDKKAELIRGTFHVAARAR